ncbi:hypothetical protein D5085_04240 [Ectothiorhodospiraceae bacterium BW-2]|nr:hypothetical protein D5085_04240 [Ectothiorhodospiraceae bacterium BW-2]
MSQAEPLLIEYYSACVKRGTKLKESLDKCYPLFPLNETTLLDLTTEQEEAFDALILRYSQLTAMVQDHLFRLIAIVEQEDVSQKSNRDKALLMEKLGVIHSADDFSIAVQLRNKFSHHYPDQVTRQVERLNMVLHESKTILSYLKMISNYLQRKGFINQVWESGHER